MYPEFNPQPDFVISDFSPSINKVIRENCPDSVHIKCVFHLNKALKSKLKDKKLFTNDIKPQTIPQQFKSYFDLRIFNRRQKKYSVPRIIEYDISILMKLPTKELFNEFWRIITPFWKKYAKQFFDYFKAEYIDDELKQGWRYYFSPEIPKTNNALEAYNKTLKTLINRRQKNFEQYLEIIQKEILARSTNSNMSFPEVPHVPNCFYVLAKALSQELTTHLFQDGNNYYVKDSTVNFPMFNKKKKGLAPSLNSLQKKISNDCKSSLKEFLDLFTKPSKNQVELYTKGSANAKEEFLSLSKIRLIKFNGNNDKPPLKRVSCTCPNYGETGFCLHTLTILIKLKLVNIQQLLKKPKRGRKPKNTPALQKDEVESNSDSGSDLSEYELA